MDAVAREISQCDFLLRNDFEDLKCCTLMSKSTLSCLASDEAQFKAIKGAMNQRLQQVEQSQTRTEQTTEWVRERRSETQDLSPGLRVITTGGGLCLHAIKPLVTRVGNKN